MISRNILSSLSKSLSYFPVVAILGPRQAAKTTLIKHLLNIDNLIYLDLENPAEKAKLQDPLNFFEQNKGCITRFTSTKFRKLGRQNTVYGIKAKSL